MQKVRNFSIACLYLFIVLGLLTIASSCFRWAAASVMAVQLEHHLNKEESSNTNLKNWRLAKQHLDKMLELRPNHAKHLELAEYFYQTLDSFESDAPDLIANLDLRDNETKALELAKRALQLRPSWPFLWRQYVLSKITLHQMDLSMNDAFDKAVDLGKWQKSVVLDLSGMGLNNWDALPERTHTSVRVAINQLLLVEQDQNNLLNLLQALHAEQACASGIEALSVDLFKLKEYCLHVSERT